MDWIRDHLWESWLIAAMVLGGLEMLSLDLVFVMLAGGALVGAATGALSGSIGLSVVLAALTAVGLLGLLRPNLLKSLHAGPSLKTGHETLIGKRASVTSDISGMTSGRIKIEGEDWAALPYDEDDRIEAGEIVQILEIKGATAYVLRVHALGS